jgi:hypothetical protein
LIIAFAKDGRISKLVFGSWTAIIQIKVENKVKSVTIARNVQQLKLTPHNMRGHYWQSHNQKY